MGKLLLTNGLHEIGNDHEEDDEQVIISHLHVVGFHLKGGEECRHDESRQITSSISQDNTGNRRWKISQCHHLPQVTGSNDDEEIGRESPHDTTQGCQRLAEVKGSQQDIEA